MSGRTRIMTGVLALGAVAIWLTVPVVSQDNATASSTPDFNEMMAKWAALNAKGPEHAKLAQMVGTWDTETKMWMAPGAPPTVSHGTAEFRLILDGRYLEQTFRGEVFGQPFEGRAVEGYDRIKKKYVSTWIDSMSTGFFISEGTTDATGKVCTYYGKSHDPLTGELDKMMRSVAREVDANTAVFEMYETRAGVGEIKSMEITYKRKR